MRAVVSPKRRRASAAPPSPESFETTSANRSSEAPAHRAVFPSRECPMTATRPPSTSGSFARHVERAAEAPGPGADRSPVVGTEAAGGARADPGPHAASPAVRVVGLEVAVVDGRHRVAAVENPLDGPGGRVRPPRGLGRAVLHDARALVHPRGREPDARVGVDRVVAVEVQAEEGGDRPARRVRDVEQDLEGGPALGAVQEHAHLPPGGQAPERARRPTRRRRSASPTARRGCGRRRAPRRAGAPRRGAPATPRRSRRDGRPGTAAGREACRPAPSPRRSWRPPAEPSPVRHPAGR